MLLLVAVMALEGAGGHPYISNALSFLTNGVLLEPKEGTVMPAVNAWSNTFPRLRELPMVDVGVNHGLDLALPAAKLGHRVYAYEPTNATFYKWVDTPNVEALPTRWAAKRRFQFMETSSGGTAWRRCRRCASRMSLRRRGTAACTF